MNKWQTIDSAYERGRRDGMREVVDMTCEAIRESVHEIPSAHIIPEELLGSMWNKLNKCYSQHN